MNASMQQAIKLAAATLELEINIFIRLDSRPISEEKHWYDNEYRVAYKA